MSKGCQMRLTASFTAICYQRFLASVKRSLFLGGHLLAIRDVLGKFGLILRHVRSEVCFIEGPSLEASSCQSSHPLTPENICPQAR